MTARYTGANHHAVRQNNRSVIFRAIYESAPIARVDIAERTGLTAKTVSTIVDELIEHGLVREIGHRTPPQPRAGRKAVELQVNPASRYAVGVDASNSAITGALVDLAGETHERVEYPPPAQPWRIEQAIPTAAQVAGQLLAGLSRAERAKVVGVGIGAPGRFRAQNGHRFGLPGRDPVEWVDLGPTAELDQQLGRSTYIDNNVNTSALAELWFGAGKGVDNFIVLNLSIGIAMSIVTGGDIYRGGNQNVGEAYHITVNTGGPVCYCGNTGCLGQYASVPAVLGNVRARLAAGEPSTLNDNPDLTIKDVITAFHAQDTLATSVFADVTHHLASALVTLAHTIDPQMILIVRDLATAGEPLITPLRAEVRRRVPPPMRDRLRIEVADVTDAPVIGAATLALREFFRAPL